MRRLSVVAKLWLAFTGLIIVVLFPLEFALNRLLTNFYASQVTEPLTYHSEQLAAMMATDPAAIQMAPMMGRMVGGEVLILDANGTPVVAPGISTLTPPDGAVRTARNGVAFAGQVDLAERGSVILTAVPIPGPGGAVALIAPAEPVQRSLTLARRYLWAAVGGTLLLGTGTAFMIARSLLRPVIAMEAATAHIARGDFSTRVTVQSTDEIGQLAAAVNQMTAQLESYEKRRREFFANVAHELRTPISYIRGYAQAIAEQLVTTPADQERYVRIIQEESIRLGKLVDDLLDLAQMDEGQLVPDLVTLDLHLPLDQAVAVVTPLAEQKQVKVQVRVPEQLPLVKADGGRIQQVIVNLLDNGLRHTPQGGSLTVRAQQDEDALVVRVSNTGEGVDPEDLPLLFERFYKRKSHGRGLGLAIVRSIIRAHGGEVGVENHPGQGATFWFRLPVLPDS